MALKAVPMAALLAGCLLGAVCLECRKSRGLWTGLLLFFLLLGCLRYRAAEAEAGRMRAMGLDREEACSVAGTVKSLEPTFGYLCPAFILAGTVFYKIVSCHPAHLSRAVKPCRVS